jgi:hypothetical protein
LPSQGKVFIRVKDKEEAVKQLKKMKVKYTEEEPEVHGTTWWNKNKTVAELNKNLLILYEATKVQQNRLDEALDKKDYIEIKDIIRAEIAAVFFDLFKKKQMWI